MKPPVFLNVIVALALTVITASGQGNCKVLLPGIAESYTGSCKNGLADGQGEAFGTDQYKGEFRKGLPDGAGIYIWHSGEKYEGSWKKGIRDGEGTYTFTFEGRDSILKGIWKEDKYVGEKIAPPFVIQYRNSITRVSCVRMGDIPYVEYKFSRSGATMNEISNLLMQGSTGSESTTSNFVGFEQVVFPFTGKIKFNAPSALYTSTLNCELRLLINQPGSWIVTIYY